MASDESVSQYRALMRPIEGSVWILIAFGLLSIWWLPVSWDVQRATFACLLVSSVSYWVLFHKILARKPTKPWLGYLPIVVNLLVVGGLYYWLGQVLKVEMVFLVIIVSSAIRRGRTIAVATGGLAGAIVLLIDLSRAGTATTLLFSSLLTAVVFIVSGYLAGSMAETIGRQSEEAEKKSRTLSLLLETSDTAAGSLDLQAVLPRLAEKVAKGIPATFCHICLADRDGNHLVSHAIYPRDSLEQWEKDLGGSWDLARLPMHRKALDAGQIVVVRQDQPGLVLADQDRTFSFIRGTTSACVVPIVFEGKHLGLITVGEDRKWRQETISAEKVDLLKTLASQVGAVVNNTQLHQAVQRQAQRMAMLNESARALGSTIEMDDLLEHIYEELRRVIPTETYYVALGGPYDEMIDIRVLFDDGKRYPSTRIPLGTGLASIVIRDRKPLLCRHLSVERHSLTLQPTRAGTNRESESWLGVPILVHDQIRGALAVASYKPNAFDEDDLALLSNVAVQVGLALDNARHHSEVEDQARRDSLTGALNHGYFLGKLALELQESRLNGQTLTLIMVDLDHFKEYNDSYGHVIGDEVLRLTVQAIRAHLKAKDDVGRWGGEEFAILLPGASLSTGYQVAKRIRGTLAELALVNRDGMPIPKPTVSQGIANFPSHANGAESLVDVADQALYCAKAAGRDQIMVASMGVKFPVPVQVAP